ncbi:MAG: hypothetical protein H8D80_02460 [Proteobacteria bacterium]|nr:hypothetical protein [Pseudomonadota bacterium]
MAGTWTSISTIPSALELVTNVNHQCVATFDEGEVLPNYFITDGSVLPSGLNLGTGGLLSGIVLEMDSFVPEYKKPEGFKLDEQNYATFGSAKEGSKTFSFSIDAVSEDGGTATQVHNITINNNWSSDRDELIREIDNDFFIDGVVVSNEEYLITMKSRGYFPAT